MKKGGRFLDKLKDTCMKAILFSLLALVILVEVFLGFNQVSQGAQKFEDGAILLDDKAQGNINTKGLFKADYINHEPFREALLESLFKEELQGFKEKVSIQSLEVWSRSYLGSKLEWVTVDLVLKHTSGFQWLQLSVLWDPVSEKILNKSSKTIDYLARVTEPVESLEAIDIAKQILTSLKSPDESLMGWRYRNKKGLGVEGLKEVEIKEIYPLAANIYQTEVAVMARYKVHLFDKVNEVNSILYFKKYEEGIWQLEDIKVLEIRDREKGVQR